VEQVYCFVGPVATETASERVLSILKKRFLMPTLQPPLDKLHCLPAKLEEENLGLGVKSYEELRNNVSTIITVSEINITELCSS
jgi:thioester reductase-like protein